MKDSKGHGSAGKGVGNFTRQELIRNYGVMHGTAAMTKAAARLPKGGPHKVQSLDTNRAGQPWATAKSYGNKTVAERVANYMRTDGGYMRVRTHGR